jgi:histidine ammonia-lyase
MLRSRQRPGIGLKLHQGAPVAALLALALTLAVLDRPPAGAGEASGVRETAGVPSRAGQRPEVAAARVVLDGRSLTIPQVMAVARGNAEVSLDPEAMRRVRQSFDLLLGAAEQGIPIYGLNRGVGENKDKTIFSGAMNPEARRASERFNANNLRATSAGVGPEASEELVRAAMVIRLNTILVGYTGARPVVAERYRDFLNLRIHPVMPTRASVGEADITILAHIGLAMMGEGEVIYAGRRMPAGAALGEAGLEPLVPFAKDALVIMSSNAYAAALAAFAVGDAEHLLAVTRKVLGLSLEGLNGNLAPYLPVVNAVRPYAAQGRAAAGILAELEGSYLWQPSGRRALQDPLSFRTASQVLGVAEESVGRLKEMLAIQINSSDDNPASIPGIAPPPDVQSQVRSYYVTTGAVRGAVIPTANFEPLPWVVPLESLGIALSHVSGASAARSTRLGTAEFTRLSRFLSPDDTTLAYSAVQKVYAALDLENQELSKPVSRNPLPLAGDIEDTGTSSAAAAQRVLRIVDNLYYVIGLELMHAAQAVDLRRRADPGLALGGGTGALLQSFRQVVPFLDHDHPLTPNIRASYRFLRQLDIDR